MDARTPLLVAEPQGVRIRLGRTWRGLTWSSLERVEHAPAGRVRAGLLLLVSRNPERTLDGLSGASLRQARWSERLCGSSWPCASACPRRPATRTTLTAALQGLAAGSNLVVQPLPVLETDVAPVDRPGRDHEVPVRRRFWRDPRPVIAETIDRVAASGTPAPLREATPGRRAEVTVPLAAEAPVADDTQPIRLEAGELRRPGSVSLVEDTQAWGDRDWDDHVHPIARGGASVEPLVIDDFAAEPAPDPVVGPELAAARTRLGLTVDELAERTRIRPHVIEAIEVDDFEACGGDFYARGHPRTLARVLGVDVAPLLADFEERYSQAPIDPRKVFEAELASSRPRPELPPSRLAILVPGLGGSGASSQLRHLAFLPDGQTVVYAVAGTDGDLRLMRHALDAEAGTPIENAVGMGSPLVSPDGRWILGTQAVTRQVLRLPLDGGTQELVSSSLSTSDAAFAPDGKLWYSSDADLGTVEGDSLVARLHKGGYHLLQILDNGRSALTVRTRVGNAAGPIVLVDLETGAETQILSTPVVEARGDPGTAGVRDGRRHHAGRAVRSGPAAGRRVAGDGGDQRVGHRDRGGPVRRRRERQRRLHPAGAGVAGVRRTGAARADWSRRSGGTSITRCSRPTAAGSRWTSTRSRGATSGSSTWARARSRAPPSTATGTTRPGRRTGASSPTSCR